MKSKLAFASEKDARDFIAAKGGKIGDFSEAFAMASQELQMSRSAIDAKRKKTGKIKVPSATEACVVCGMYPDRYPKHRSQILTTDKKTLHFCSTRCLVHYRAQPSKYRENPSKEMFIWVTVYPEGMYEYAGGLFYVVGSDVPGPMGPEAIPFRTKAEAEAFAAKEGGKVMRFNEIVPGLFQKDREQMKMMKKE
jgi:nitrous oxide reductase accessory protein NosL